MEIFAFFMGILFFYTHHPLLLILCGALFCIDLKPQTILFFCAGIGIALVHDYQVKPRNFPDVPVIACAEMEGTIASIPLKKRNKTQFNFTVETLNHKPAHGLVQLAWYNHPPTLHAGQHLILQAKLKKPRNYVNPGSDNYVQILASKHLYWAGYVKSAKISSSPNPQNNWEAFREHLDNKLTSIAPNRATAGILEALTLNMTTFITQEQWELFRRTGTTHLFGISGEHIALISGFVFFLVKWLWTRSPTLCLKCPANYPASLCGLIAAFFYALLAGFAPPVQRALAGCFCYTLYFLGKQRFSPWQIWRYALFAVLAFEPHAVFMQGFYFSFLAVACLLLTQQRWQLKGYQGKLALQLSCLIGLMPLTLYWYSYGSINGFIANLFAIPLVGLLIMPGALLCLCCCHFEWVWLITTPLAWLVSLLYQGLQYTEHLALLNLSWPIPHVYDALALLAALLIGLLLPHRAFILPCLIGLIIPLFPEKLNMAQGEAIIRVLDVGQGLSVAVHTQHHTLLYDTGDQFYLGSDLGKLVVLPYLRDQSIKELDAIVISHPDRDHRGGLQSIEQTIPSKQFIVNDPDFYHRGRTCHDFPDWEWDGVHFHFFALNHPFKNRNNTSCILQIRTQTNQVLLTGDIEREAEEFLVEQYGAQLASDVLVLPHHGSKTSSTIRFLSEIHPRYAIASLGFDNRFHFPHPKTLNSLKLLDIEFYRTDTCGMTTLFLNHTKGVIPQCETS